MTQHTLTYTPLSDRQQAACWGIETIACMRLGLDTLAYERAVLAVRAGARALTGLSVVWATAGGAVESPYGSTDQSSIGGQGQSNAWR